MTMPRTSALSSDGTRMRPISRRLRPESMSADSCRDILEQTSETMRPLPVSLHPKLCDVQLGSVPHMVLPSLLLLAVLQLRRCSLVY